MQRLLSVSFPLVSTRVAGGIDNEWERQGRTLNVILRPPGAIASSFHEIRCPKPATPITRSVIYARRVRFISVVREKDAQMHARLKGA